MNAPLKLPKLKKCKVCREQFQPFRTTQQVCSPVCAQAHVEAVKAKKARIEYRDTKEKMKGRNEWLADVQVVFNKFIRMRDANLPCISCGRIDVEWKAGGAWDCGHYLTRGGFPELRFEELNAHKQCKSCNSGSYHHARKQVTVSKAYRIGLIERIGLEKVLWLEGPHEPKKYTIDELKALKAEFKRKCKEMNHG